MNELDPSSSAELVAGRQGRLGGVKSEKKKKIRSIDIGIRTRFRPRHVHGILSDVWKMWKHKIDALVKDRNTNIQGKCNLANLDLITI